MFSTIGTIHLIASLVALATGTVVLIQTKATLKHKQWGYLYVISMITVLVTSFFIYRLHGHFGILHLFAVLSSLTLLAGMIPIWRRKRKDYLALHFSFMYWSVIGLYCAFCAEVFTRLPMLLQVGDESFALFYILVGVSSGATGWIGSYFFKKKKLQWAQQFT
ncbi:DUF2306 domain-containing protein [Croceiramulus getboli]|nr:DUF2306 domain-containing protein [Flavobacteriaceae bacterium YJPT1-3]